MAGIGDLVAHLGLDNSGFKKGLSSSRSMLSSFAGGVAGLISPIGAAFAGIAGTAGIGLMVKSSFEAVDGLSELGGTLGKSAAEMAGWEHAAKLSGMSMEDMTSGIRRLQKEGVDILQFADQLAAVRDPAEQARMAMEVFGKSGGKFLPLLQGGSEAIRELVAEGSKLSGLEGLDTSKVEAANDAIDRSKAAFQGVANIVAVAVAPAIEWAATKVQEFGLWAQGGISQAVEYFEVVEYGFTHIGDAVELVGTEIALFAVVAFEELNHLFTTQIPAVVSFMVDNAGRLMVDGFGGAVEALADNMADGFGEIADFVTSWGEDPIEFNWKPLGEGFAEVMKDMPEIAERDITELEKQLAADADRLGKSFGDGLAEHMAAQEAERAALASPTNATLPGAFSGVVKESKPANLKAAFAGSQEAASIMLRGVGGGKSMEQIAQKQLTVQQQTLTAIKSNKPQPLTPLTLGT